MALLDDQFAARLESLPAAAEVVDGLFGTARGVSEARVFVAVVDVERWIQDGKPYLTCQLLNHMVVQQFAEYFSQIITPIDQLPNASMGNLFRRLQMLAYSQFWECHAIQRLLLQIVQISQGEVYNPRLLIDSRMKTANVYEFLVAHSRGLNSSLSEFLVGVYSNQIRNAFAHSEFCVLGEYISFFNYDAKVANHVPSLRLDTWDKLFKATSEFIIALFEKRRALEKELKSRSPYRVELPEFAGPILLSRDGHGYWSAQSTA